MELWQGLAAAGGILVLAGVAYLLSRATRRPKQPTVAARAPDYGLVKPVRIEAFARGGGRVLFLETYEADSEAKGRAFIQDVTIDDQDRMVDVVTPAGMLSRTQSGLDFARNSSFIHGGLGTPMEVPPALRARFEPSVPSPNWGCLSCGHRNAIDEDDVPKGCSTLFACERCGETTWVCDYDVR